MVFLVERELAEPVDVLKALAVDGVGKAILVEKAALGGDGPSAGEVVPEVGLVVAVDTAGDENDRGRQQRPHPRVGRKPMTNTQ